MREFKVGDKVRVTKPDGIIGSPGWFNGMDEEADRELTVSFVGRFLGVKDSFFCYAPEWCELITTEYDPINHPDHYQSESSITGGRVNYYLAHIYHPQREDQPAYTAECEDIISALAMTFDEANIFKEIWRSANARLGNGKPDHKALYGAEKINHYAGRNLRRHQREAQK